MRMFPAMKKPTGLIVATTIAILLSACNLGAGNNPEPTLSLGTVEAVPPQDTDGGTGDGGVVQPTADPNLQPTTEGPPATSTPAAGPALQPSEQITSITVVSDTFTTNEPLTIQVQRGSAVGSIGCSITLQATAETEALTGNTTAQIDDTTFRETYTYTPSRAGEYSVTCTGLATTASGTERVSQTSNTFTIEAKGG